VNSGKLRHYGKIKGLVSRAYNSCRTVSLGAFLDPILIPIELRCGKCGAKALVAEGDGDNPADDALVTCTSCGAASGRWADVRQQALASSTEQIKKRLKDSFGDGFKPS
jgi:hypothetical protein